MTEPLLRKALGDFRWDGVELRAYKDEATAPFRGVTRQVLASATDLSGELRYFEVAPDGWTTLERHQHVHAVTILRGNGQALVGDKVLDVAPLDLVTVPAWAWHQFRATAEGPLGFLCMVDAERDRPQLPTAEERARLEALPEVARFLAGEPS
jgi:mannose-6-phosphate isomerase-like protein (cupin superfamily)